MLPTIQALQTSLNNGETSATTLTESALRRIEDTAGEGARAFTQVYREQALAAARASDTLRAAGLARSPLEGLPVSVKDLFDVAGQETWSGSTVLRGSAPAASNAPIVQRLLAAGAIVVGKTNMTEFAFSGLGINPHYGTPSSPWDRATGRIPGGSSSGAGVAVADGMSVVSIGTDTGGSVRIPSAFCGLTGFKPTARRVPSQGAVPLSFSLDSIGPLGASVDCCAITDAILAGQPWPGSTAPAVESPGAGGLRLAVPKNVVLDGADDAVRAAFDRALQVLRDHGAQIEYVTIPEFDELADINRKGGLVCAEAWAWHQRLLARAEGEYDPRVASRILRGRDMTAADYIEVMQVRPRWAASVAHRLTRFDAMLLPTVPVVAPAIATLKATDEAYFAANGLILRNPTLINFLDGCALSLPCHASDEAPVGLMVAGPAMADARILQAGREIEQALTTVRQTGTTL
ncbi:amidase [Pusillimonas sp. TS35]|uniref:amidase n=1 Tax=Paracandidimonas lactea TaxID=2895524 RepID=UPI0013687B2A|nr:amidase [Paracandidimonas lactea]MYN14094.1 amidase [Pusillimonas sp. TS35]